MEASHVVEISSDGNIIIVDTGYYRIRMKDLKRNTVYTIAENRKRDVVQISLNRCEHLASNGVSMLVNGVRISDTGVFPADCGIVFLVVKYRKGASLLLEMPS